MKTIHVIFFLLSACILIHCRESDNINVQGDYLPLKEHSEWIYLSKYIFSSYSMFTDTTKIVIKGDTTLEGLIYKKIVNEYGNLETLVRKQHGKYYGRNHDLYRGFTKEYLFLDERATANTTWRHYKNDSTDLTEYKVTAVNSTRTYNNVEYKNVIEMEVNYYYFDIDKKEFLLKYSTLHYYANGIGEIYSYYPPIAKTYSTLECSLLMYIP